MGATGGRTTMEMMTGCASLRAMLQAAAGCRSLMRLRVRIAYEDLQGSKTGRRRGRASYPSVDRRRSTIRERGADRYTA